MQSTIQLIVIYVLNILIKIKNIYLYVYTIFALPSFINTIYIKYIDFYEIAYIYNFLSKYKARLEKYTFVKKKKIDIKSYTIVYI